MRATPHRRGSVTLAIALLTLVTAGCSGSPDPDIDLTATDIQAMSCDLAEDVLADTQRLVDDLDNGDRNRLERQLDTDVDVWLNTRLQNLQERVTECRKEATDSSAATTTEDPPEETSATATKDDDVETTSTPTSTAAAPTGETTSDDGATETTSAATSANRSMFVGWDDVLVQSLNSPELKKLIEEHSSDINFDWGDVEDWADARTSDGNLVDARVVLAGSQVDMTKQEARKEVGVGDDVNVLRVNSCGDVVGTACPDADGLVVILAPLGSDDDVEHLLSGVGFVPDTESLLLYTTQRY